MREGLQPSYSSRPVVPPAPDQAQQEGLKGAVEQPPAAGIKLANWYWKGVRQFVLERFGFSLSRSSCLNYLHRLGFVLKRLKNGSIPVGAGSYAKGDGTG